ncbi:GlxA family transcriptional regulator [Noviherbaspirillum humi]|uniref:GlxA family transcriptional regulator n=1 Tax=Noviherbaspirillum humi TaxID=1688639 RepID=UPI001C3D7C2F|nr:helix-turn-helix domain-containing protein [Noviherbaspirillum humi]
MLLLDSGYASLSAAPIDIFHSAGRLWNHLHGQGEAPRFSVRMVSIDGKPVAGVGAYSVVPDAAIHQVERSDLVLVPSGDVYGSGLDPRLVRWMRDMYEGGSALAGLCSGATYLAETGLLDNRMATTHWALVEDMRARYPRVRWCPERLITEDGRLFCSGGVYSALDLSLYLVEKFAGREIALQCAKSLLLGMPRMHQSAYFGPLAGRPHADDKVREIEAYMHEHYHEALTIDALAGRAAMGTRNFIRRFKAATGQMPGAYLQALRIAEAKGLLESSGPSIQRICMKVGYQDLSHFRELFKRHTGMTPAEYRRQFGPVDVLCRD